MSKRVFLSAASDEFGKFRKKLAPLLQRAGFNVEHQEILPQTPCDIVRKLGRLIKDCRLLIHIVGHTPGLIADAEAVNDLLDEICPDKFLVKYPKLRKNLGDLSGITFTQWEAFLALHYGVPVLVYVPSDACEPGTQTLKCSFAQKQHLDRLRVARRFPEWCSDEAELVGKIEADVIRDFRLSDQSSMRAVTEFLRVTDSFFQYRAPAASGGGVAADGRGDFRFTAEEFRTGAVHRPQVVDVALNRLRRDGCVWLEGPSAGGKTTVCLHLVAEWNRLGCEPLYLDIADGPDAEQAACEIAAYAEPGRMFILDNVHDGPKVACALLDHWKTQRRDSVMILLGWPVAIRSGQDYMGGHRHAIVPVAVKPEDWIGVYQSTFRLVRGPRHSPPVPPAHVIGVWDDTFAADLVTFQYALAAGLRLQSGNVFQIEPAAADRYVREKYLAPCSQVERDDLFVLAWVADLGIALGEESTRSGFPHSLGCGLVRSTLHGRFRNHVRFQPWHRSFGRLLLRLASLPAREPRLCEAATASPFFAGILAARLCQRYEEPLAVKVLEQTLNAHPSLTDWFGDNLCIGAALLRQTKGLVPARWNEVVARLALPATQSRLKVQAFATPPHFLVTFLQFTGQNADLKPVHGALVKALVADVKLPAGQSRLLAQAFATPLHLVVTFLRFTGKTKGLKRVHSALVKALAVDAKLPADQSRLPAQAFATPLDDLAKFLEYAQGPMPKVWQALADALGDAKNRQTLVDAALATPLGNLPKFLRYAKTNLRIVWVALAKALAEEKNLQTLVRVSFGTPLHNLGTFIQFTGRIARLKPVHDALVKPLVEDAALPGDKSQLIQTARTTSFDHLWCFVRHIREEPQLKFLAATLEGDRLCSAILNSKHRAERPIRAYGPFGRFSATWYPDEEACWDGEED